MNLYITNLQSRSSYLGYTQHKPWLFPVILVASWKLSANFAPGPGHQHQVHVQVSQLKGPGLKKHLWNDLFLGDTRCHTYGVCHTYSIYIHDTTIVSSESVSFLAWTTPPNGCVLPNYGNSKGEKCHVANFGFAQFYPRVIWHGKWPICKLFTIIII